MKKILFIIALAISFSVKSQTYTPLNQTVYGQHNLRIKIDSTLYIPTGCGVPSAISSLNSILIKQGAIYFDSCSGKEYIFNPKDSTWKQTGYNSLPWDSITGKPVNFSTTYSLSNDIQDSIQSRLRWSDTAAMLTPFMQYSDTSYMLSGYARSGNVVKYTDVNVNNGIAGLDAGGKVPFSLLPAALMIYKGTWNASTNTPALSDGTGVTGWIYIVSTGGTVNTGSGAVTYSAGDYAIYNGTAWERSVGTNNVASVNGQQGVVTLTTTNIGEGTNLYYTDARARGAFTAGTGISLSSGTITNTAPDQTVSLTNGGNITITGTYPNFTLTNGITNNNQLTNGAGYLTANQTINFSPSTSGDVTGTSSGGTSLSPVLVIGAGKVTNAMLAGSIDYAKMNAATVPTWNQNTTGNAATATYATSAGNAGWNGYNGAVYTGGGIGYMLVWNNTLSTHQDASASYIQSWLGLGPYAYRSSGLAELSGATFTGNVTANNGSVFIATSSLSTVTTVMQSDNTSGYIGTNTNHPLVIRTNSTAAISIATTGATTFTGNSTGTIASFTNTNTAGTGNGLLIDVQSQLGTDNYVMNLITNGTSRFYVREDGNVGIGTTSPGYKLDVNGTLGVAGAATFSSSVTATSLIVSQVEVTSNQIYRNSASEFYVNYSGTGNTILGNGTGNVSINAGTNPSYRLHVGGTLGVTGAATFSSSISSTGGGAYVRDIVSINSNAYPSTYPTSIGSNTSAIGYVQLGNNSDNYIVGGSTATGGNLRFYVNNTSILPAAPNGTLALTIASNATITAASSVTANSFVKSGGTSSQYLMADGSTSTLPEILNNSYTPTYSTGSNVSSYTIYNCSYTKIGDAITVTGQLSVIPTIGGTVTSFEMSYPLTTGTSTASVFNGTGSAIDQGTNTPISTAVEKGTGENMKFSFKAGTTLEAHLIKFTFTYKYIAP